MERFETLLTWIESDLTNKARHTLDIVLNTRRCATYILGFPPTFVLCPSAAWRQLRIRFFLGERERNDFFPSAVSQALMLITAVLAPTAGKLSYAHPNKPVTYGV
jgi:hypothetical protein